jgi:hypothetical protein
VARTVAISANSAADDAAKVDVMWIGGAMSAVSSTLPSA